MRAGGLLKNEFGGGGGARGGGLRGNERKRRLVSGFGWGRAGETAMRQNGKGTQKRK